jgi:Outer membrane protein beta-barrel domain
MRRPILLTVLTLGATAAQAENRLFYVGAGVTDSSFTANNNGFIAYANTDLKNKSWKAFAGVRPLNWLAVETDYIDLGSGNSGSTGGDTFIEHTNADSSAWAAYAIGFLPVPLPVVDFYGKVGVARWKLKENLIMDYFNVDNLYPPHTSVYPKNYSGTNFAWGIGAQTHISVAGVRLEYEAFDVLGSTAKVASLSVFLNF